MLNKRVAAISESYGAPPALVARARRRRTARSSALVVTVVLVDRGHHRCGRADRRAAGQEPARHELDRRTATNAVDADHDVTDGGVDVRRPRPRVVRVACPVIYGIAPTATPGAFDGSRVTAAGDAVVFRASAYFAATTDPRYVALGPARLDVRGEGRGRRRRRARHVPAADAGGRACARHLSRRRSRWITTTCGTAWSATALACSVSTDPGARDAKAEQLSEPCTVPAGRTLTPCGHACVDVRRRRRAPGRSVVYRCRVTRRRRRLAEHAHVQRRWR